MQVVCVTDRRRCAGPFLDQVARLAAARLQAGQPPPPAPLYLRPADAAPPREAAPALLDDA